MPMEMMPDNINNNGIFLFKNSTARNIKPITPLIMPANSKAGNAIKETIDGFKSPFKGRYGIRSFRGILG